MQALSVDEVLDKGLRDESSLSKHEWPIYAVAYLESIADMEGWDYFFTYNMEWCPLVLRVLKLAGDLSSLRIIEDYRKHFEKLGIRFTANEIDVFLQHASDVYLSECPDWRDQFSELAEQRWQLITQHYRSIGVDLRT